MISDKIESTLPCHHPIDLQDKATLQKFYQWMAKSKLIQIRAVTALTALLYIVAYITDTFVAPTELLDKMLLIHLYILPPFLFLISLLTYKKELSAFNTVLLIIAPIVAAAGNLYIVSGLENPSMRLTEIYLMLFWIFTVSGLRLKHATISSTIIFIMVFIMTYFYLPFTLEYFVMHCFWMSAAFSFGFLSAFLIEKSNQSVFINQEKLKKLVITDKLTGLHNRVHLDAILQEELNRSQRYKHTFGLVLMDLDNFKTINDSYGHLVGDETLVETAKLIKEHLRSTDKVVRWGGEEFIIIYLDTNHQELLQLAENLCQTIETHSFKTVGKRTASFGVTLNKDEDTIDSIIKRADTALYRAKANGKNCLEYV